MAYYNTCSLCGANLDPGEKCTCVEDAKAEAEQKEVKRLADLTMQFINQSKRRKRK